MLFSQGPVRCGGDKIVIFFIFQKPVHHVFIYTHRISRVWQNLFFQLLVRDWWNKLSSSALQRGHFLQFFDFKNESLSTYWKIVLFHSLNSIVCKKLFFSLFHQHESDILIIFLTHGKLYKWRNLWKIGIKIYKNHN